MPRRWLGLRPWIWLAALLVILLVLQQTPVGKQIGPRLTLFFTPLVSALQAPANWWDQTRLWFENSRHLQQENLRLHRLVQQQASLRLERDALRAENVRLRGLLDLGGLPGFDWHAARVLGRSPDKKSQRLILQTRSKVSRDDVVASSEGLVGLVDSVNGHHVVVRTILDASLAVPVSMPGTDIAALARGQGDRLMVEFIVHEKAPPSGSILYTSGAGGLFPPGIPVARIRSIHEVPGSVFAEVEAEPAAHWRRDAWLSIATHSRP